MKGLQTIRCPLLHVFYIKNSIQKTKIQTQYPTSPKFSDKKQIPIMNDIPSEIFIKTVFSKRIYENSVNGYKHKWIKVRI